jgi:hypothetical protein
MSLFCGPRVQSFFGAPICDDREKPGMIESWTHHECAPVIQEVQFDPGPTIGGFIQGSRSAYERLAEYVAEVRKERSVADGASGKAPGDSVRCVAGFDSRGEQREGDSQLGRIRHRALSLEHVSARLLRPTFVGDKELSKASV